MDACEVKRFATNPVHSSMFIVGKRTRMLYQVILIAKFVRIVSLATLIGCSIYSRKVVLQIKFVGCPKQYALKLKIILIATMSESLLLGIYYI